MGPVHGKTVRPAGKAGSASPANDMPSEQDHAHQPSSLIERIMARPLPAWVLLLALWLGIVLVIAFGALVRYPPDSPALRQAIWDVADIPRTIGRLLPSLAEPFRPDIDGPYRRRAQGLWRNTASGFVDPGYVLLTAFDEDLKRPVVRLIRLSDGAIMHQYAPDINAVNRRSTFHSALIDLARDRDVTTNLMMHPLLMPDGGLVVHDSSPLARFDACGRLEWMIDGIFHHSAEQDAQGNIWASFRLPKAQIPDVGPMFNDEGFMQVSPQGKVLYQARIVDILDRNGLGALWRSHPYTDDPFHLNDVQPVLTSGRYWHAGDLFLSLRNQSAVLLYRPATGKVIWSQVGPWAMQHDISIIDDHRISIFDNNWRVAYPEGAVDGVNRIAVYDFATGQTSFPMDQVMRKLNIHTHAQGRATPLPGGDFMIEETERGRLLRASPQGDMRWRYTSATPTMNRLQLRWSRYIDPADARRRLDQIKGMTCK